MADLQELLARLNGSNSGAAPNSAGNPAYQQPTVSSPISSPAPGGPQPHHPSAIISPNMSAANTPVPEGSGVPPQQQQTPQQQSTQLLNLLRFNSQPNVTQQSVPAHRRPSYNSPSAEGSNHGRQVSASDLVASFMGKTSSPAAQPASASASVARLEHGAPASSENPQDMLLRLLNQPKPAQPESRPSSFDFASTLAASAPAAEVPEADTDDLAQDLVDAKLEKVPSDPHAAGSTTSPMRVFGTDSATQPSPFAPEAPTPSRSQFTYVNPFEKLEAASPRVRTPVLGSSKSPAPTSSSAPKMEILKPKHSSEPSSIVNDKDSQPHKSHKPLPEALEMPHETVAKAVNDLGEQLDQEVEQALAEAELKSDVVKEMEEAIVETATEIKKELQDDANAKALEETVGQPMADVLKEVASEIAQADVADSWESAETEDSPKDEEQTVTVYQFPMRAFSSIAVQELPQRATFAPGAIMDIARLKKEFDQIDRSLVSATKNFIVYALAKKGGFKIIRQENGQHRQVFEGYHERIFNIALCTASTADSTEALQSILGIGVNGSVFWTSLEAGREDHFSDNLDSQGLVLPPSPTQDDNTSGGQLKTRAKPSSRHPEYFAVGRGKSIHIVWAKVAAEYARDKGVCQTDKYLKERSLKILTGKAGKDFTFSEDDTVIVSLDKAGRMRFWDIRPLTVPELGIPRGNARPIEVSETLLEFHTTSPNAKSWPTSVFFFDKDRPFNKGLALRYVMVGMKQNHSFQLWDLGLGKAVQEINLPHEKESDAICSVAFHPRTGIMAVAHPTRNSIFFIHVSCPRYNMPVMNQATYIGRLASKNDKGQPPLPAVNATAIMTSIAEYSFSPKGQIRSLHMLNDPVGSANVDEPESATLFELYVMHSKGVCTVRVQRSTLGWKKDGEPVHGKKAEEEGVIILSQLKAPPPPQEESSAGGDTPAPKSTSDRWARESIKRESSNVSRQSMTPEAAMRASTLAKVESKQDAARAAIINGGEKSEKKKKKKSAAEAASQASSAPRQAPSYAQAAQTSVVPKSPAQAEPSIAETGSAKPSEEEVPAWAKKFLSQSVAAPAPAEFDAKKLTTILQNEISSSFSRELDVLYKRLDEDRRVMKADHGAKQDAILRLVSSTLTENVEGVIRSMVEENIRSLLLPKLLEQTSSTVERSVSNNLKSVLSNQLAKEVPTSVSQALKNPQTLQALSETVAKKVTTSVEPIIVASTGSVINPATTNVSNLIQNSIGEKLQKANAQRESDAIKISKLTDNVQALTQTVQSMATTQAELQAQLTKVQHLLSQSSQASSTGRASPQVSRTPIKAQQPKTPEQVEAEMITRLMADGQYEQGTMKWLQSKHTTELFNSVFVKCNPAYLSHVSPLLNLSTGAVVTDALDQNLMERLIWLDAVLKNVDPHDPETHDIVPKIMDVMNQRLTAAYIKLNESSPGNQLLRHISALVTKVNELLVSR